MGLPYDLFVEVSTFSAGSRCRGGRADKIFSSQLLDHLDGSDLISLAKVNKTFHNVLVKYSDTSKMIWKRQRSRFGFPLPPEMSEVRFALFLYSRPQLCQVCYLYIYLTRVSELTVHFLSSSAEVDVVLMPAGRFSRSTAKAAARTSE
jgi:hypothetical protein